MDEKGMEVYSVVESSGGFFRVITSRGEMVLWEGGCSFYEEVNSFEYPLGYLSKNIRAPSTLVEGLVNNVQRLDEMDEDWERRLSSEAEVVEMAVLRSERRLAKLAQKQGVDLREYFESYRGTTINRLLQHNC